MTAMASEQATWERFRSELQADVMAKLGAHISRLTWTRSQVEAAQRSGLRRLLTHAADRSPFHRERLSGLRMSEIELGDLASLPVMTKAEMMASFDNVLTDRRLNLSMVETALAATAAEPVPILGQYVAQATGGSSGRRGVFVFDRSAKAGFILSIMRGLMARLSASGRPPPGGLTFAMVAAASAVHPTAAAAAETAGHGMPVTIVSIPVTLPWGELVDRLNATGGHILGGYPSVLIRLAGEQRAGVLNLTPTMIVSTSESLLPHVRDALTEAFRAPVVDTFACTEGLVGSSDPGGSVLSFNSDLCITELVDERNRPVQAGCPSAKILLTNLYNWTQPLIRYELPDVFLAEPAPEGAGRLRARVQGRADDVLRYPGVTLHPHVIRSVLVQSRQIADYQVRQTPSGIDLDVVLAGPAGLAGPIARDDLMRRLRDQLARAGLPDPDVGLRVVGMLNRQPDSGKLSRFVPLGAR
jgi:phenylacetate-coenzyme A ligase PaaK-like adenylate-forming protein